MKETVRVVYPSPQFLLEPAHDGKPYPHELPTYMAYLRYQLRRDPVGVLDRQKHFRVLPISCVLAESSLAIMRFIKELGNATTQDVVEAGFIEPELVRVRLQSFQNRDYLSRIGPAMWRLTEKGEKTIGGAGG